MEVNTSRVIVIRKQTALSEPTSNGKINRRVICTETKILKGDEESWRSGR